MDTKLRKLWKWSKDSGGKIIAVVSGIYILFGFVGDITGIYLINLLKKPVGRLLASLYAIGYFAYLWWNADNKLKDILEQIPKIDIVNNSYIEPKNFYSAIKQEEYIGNEGPILLPLGSADPFNYKPGIRYSFGDTDNVQITGEDYYLGIVDIVNNNKGKENVQEAFRVHANISFFDLNFNEIGTKPIEGRWLDIPEPSIDYLSKGERFKFVECNIPANGNPRSLGLVAKIVEDNYCIKYSLENYEVNVNKSKFKINQKQFNIMLTISGSNFASKEFWFCVSNIVEKGKFQIQRIIKPTN